MYINSNKNNEAIKYIAITCVSLVDEGWKGYIP